MGSDQTEQYSQLELSDIIEARVEEILMFVQDEVRKLGVKQVASGYVLTGGIASMPVSLILHMIFYMKMFV